LSALFHFCPSKLENPTLVQLLVLLPFFNTPFHNT
jgi:hypothetical protein